MKKKEEKIEVINFKPTNLEADFVDMDKSEEMQKQGYRVVEIKVIEGIKKHRLEKSV